MPMVMIAENIGRAPDSLNLKLNSPLHLLAWGLRLYQPMDPWIAKLVPSRHLVSLPSLIDVGLPLFLNGDELHSLGNFRIPHV